MKKYWFWFFLATTFVCIVVLLWLNKEMVKTKPKSINSPTITINPTSSWPTLSILESTPASNIPLATKDQLLSKLPFETKQFLVEYLPKANKLYVTIKSPDYRQNYEQAVLWLSQQRIPNPKNNAEVRFVYLEKE